MTVPSGATRVDYNFSVYSSGGDATYVSSPFELSIDDVSGSGLTTTQERNDIIQVGMDAIWAELKARYPNHSVTAFRSYVVPPEYGDPWPTT